MFKINCISKFALTALIGIITLNSCQNNALDGQLVGVEREQEWQGINPFGMSYVPSGTFTMGQSDQDINHTLTQKNKSVSVQGFYMDNTEITNKEYRQFTQWVRDSIALVKLDAFIEDESGNKRLDWTYPIDWSKDSEDAQMLDDMYYQGDDMLFGKRELNPDKLIYEYQKYDLKKASSKSSRELSRSSFIEKREINVLPDKLCWVADFSYSYNEPMTRQYFDHQAFDDYPVVGVTFHQADAFCAWRTHFWNSAASEEEANEMENFRLPTEQEWEYAARGGLEGAPYPWGGPYIRNRQGCLLANFKPGRGNYPEDGGYYTVKVGSYHPNDYGLYDMSGNVSEWTSTAFYEEGYAFNHDMNAEINYSYGPNPDVDETLTRAVIRGGSWKDIGYYLQTGTRHYEFADTSKSYIGFRCALTFLGRSMSDFQ